MPDTPAIEKDEVLALLGDEYAREILVATSRESMSAKQLSEELDVDISTVYRRVDELLEQDLLVEKTRIAEGGSHHSIYEPKIDHVDVDIDDGDLAVDIHVRESAAERFTRIWDDIRNTE
ncbi:MAG: helix-turn-helix domain-containing protein [Halorientalis sp.]